MAYTIIKTNDTGKMEFQAIENLEKLLDIDGV